MAWFTAVQGLQTQVSLAGKDSISSAKEETQKYAKTLEQVQKRLGLLEKMPELAKRWEKVRSATEVTQEIATLERETRDAETLFDDMRLNPIVAEVCVRANAIYTSIKARTKPYAYWTNHFSSLETENTKKMEESFSKLAKGEEKLLETKEEAEYQKFLQELPEGDSRNALIECKTRYELQLDTAKQDIATLQELYRLQEEYRAETVNQPQEMNFSVNKSKDDRYSNSAWYKAPKRNFELWVYNRRSGRNMDGPFALKVTLREYPTMTESKVMIDKVKNNLAISVISGKSVEQTHTPEKRYWDSDYRIYTDTDPAHDDLSFDFDPKAPDYSERVKSFIKQLSLEVGVDEASYFKILMQVFLPRSVLLKPELNK